MAELYFPRKSGDIVTAYYDDGDPIIEPLAAAGLLSLASNHDKMYVARRDYDTGERRLTALARVLLGLTGEERPRVHAVFLDGDSLNYRRANLVASTPKGCCVPRKLPKAERPALLPPPTEYVPLTGAHLAIAQRHRERIAAAIGADVLAAWMADIEARHNP